MSYQEFRPTQFKVLPDVVKNLLIINGLFYLATVVLQNTYGIDLLDLLGLHYIGSDKFHPYQIVTYLFMHGSLGHIFSNMLALWMFGNVLENYWGGKRFLTFYLITGFGAALCHYLVAYFLDIHPVMLAINDFLASPSADKLDAFTVTHKFVIHSGSPEYAKQMYNEFYNNANQLSANHDNKEALDGVVNFMAYYKNYFLSEPNIVGASGAVFGVLLAFGMLFPNQMIYLYFFVPVKAKYFVIFYGAFELYNGISGSASDNVAHFAHLGGMLFGFILIKFWAKKDREHFY